jgi:hypothetical protein
MDRFALDLTLEVVEGSTHNLGDLTLWCRLRANTYNPLQPRPQLDALVRTNEQWSPMTVHAPGIGNEQVWLLVGHLIVLRWPGRELDVSAVETSLAGAQELRLRAQLNGKDGELRLTLQYGGLQGPDAEDLRKLLRVLVNTAGLPSQERWISGTSPP